MDPERQGGYFKEPRPADGFQYIPTKGTVPKQIKLGKIAQGILRVISENGSQYEGEEDDGKKHGKGKCTYLDGTVYEGEWVRGKK